MQLDPESLSVGERYKLLIGAIVPRPIAFVSTCDPLGRPNLAPFSFFNGAGSNPMSVLFCPANNADGSEKDTLANCKPVDEGGLGEFVVNASTEAYERAVAGAGEALAPGESEFDLVGLEPAPGHIVKPPRLVQSPISLECRTMHVLRLNPGEAGGGNIVVGQVVWIHAADALVNERMHVDPDKLRAIGRMGGRAYCRTGDRFEMPVGRDALG